MFMHELQGVAGADPPLEETVLTHPEDEQEPQIVAGVDGSVPSKAALAWASLDGTFEQIPDGLGAGCDEDEGRGWTISADSTWSVRTSTPPGHAVPCPRTQQSPGAAPNDLTGHRCCGPRALPGGSYGSTVPPAHVAACASRSACPGFLHALRLPACAALQRQRRPSGRRSAVRRMRSTSCGSGSPVASHISGNPDPGVMPGMVLISFMMT